MPGSLRLRIAEPRDAAAVRAIYAPFIPTNVTFEIEVPDDAEMARRIGSTLPSHPWLVAERDGAVVGYAYAGRHRARAGYRWCCEVSVYIAEEARRGGVGRALYRALFAILREQNLVHAYAIIGLPNEPSVKMHEALGFVPIARFPRVGFKNGVWRDTGWWEFVLAVPEDTPAEPRDFSEIRKSAAVRRALEEA